VGWEMSYIPSKLNLSPQCLTDSAFVVAVVHVPEVLPSPEEDLVVEVAPLVLGPVATVRLVDSYPLVRILKIACYTRTMSLP
jgi:hypothetical protein